MESKLLIIFPNEKDAQSIQSIIKSNYNEIDLITLCDVKDIYITITNDQPELILFDIDFNDIDTNQILNNIYPILNKNRIPLIILSNSSDYKKILDDGATNFIQKPFSEVTLISNLTSALKVLKSFKAIETQEKEIAKRDQWIQSQIENERLQKEIISKKNQEIMADIRYASRIQQAILPNLEFMNKNMKDYFILHQPKSHVGGDFYWVWCKEDIKVIAVGDCTGHGISGALMHMLGAVYLNEIVSNNSFTNASDIINKLRDYIMRSLKQTGESGEAQDGLDIALCVIDDKNKKLQFAGANNPLYIIRNKELIEIRGDRMPVGIHINFDKPFTNHEVNLESSDSLYLFSDGYADQFGGPKGKKFRYKQFKELLISNSHYPMNIQKEILNNVHDKWRGSLDQIDDILVFGLKIE